MPWETCLQVVLVGAAGTYLVNLGRIVAVLGLAATAGYVPAVVFHDYAGLLLPLVWLFGFWFGVQRWLLSEGRIWPAASPRPALLTRV